MYGYFAIENMREGDEAPVAPLPPGPSAQGLCLIMAKIPMIGRIDSGPPSVAKNVGTLRVSPLVAAIMPVALGPCAGMLEWARHSSLVLRRLREHTAIESARE